MNDPVMRATSRALTRIGNGLANVTPSDVAEVGADEALHPLRKLIDEWDFGHEAQEARLLEALRPLVFVTGVDDD